MVPKYSYHGESRDLPGGREGHPKRPSRSANLMGCGASTPQGVQAGFATGTAPGPKPKPTKSASSAGDATEASVNENLQRATQQGGRFFDRWGKPPLRPQAVAGRDPIALIREALCARDSLWT